MDSCRFTKEFDKFKGEINQMTWDECLCDDESCMMAEETLQLLDQVVNPSDETLKYYKDEHEARKDKLTEVRLIVCDDEFVGFMKYKDYYPEDDKKVIWADELFIHPDHRKKGYGVWAVKEAFEESGADRMKGNSLHQATDFWRGLGAWMNPIEIQGKRTFAIDIDEK